MEHHLEAFSYGDYQDLLNDALNSEEMGIMKSCKFRTIMLALIGKSDKASMLRH